MRATLEFDLPDDNEEYDRAVNGVQYYLALTSMAELLRQMIKHQELSDDAYAVTEKIRAHLYDELEDRGIQL